MPRVLRGYHPKVGRLLLSMLSMLDDIDAQVGDMAWRTSIAVPYPTLEGWANNLQDLADHFELFRPEEEVEASLNPEVAE